MQELVVNGVHLVQPRPFGASVSVTHIDLVRQKRQWRPVRIRSELVSTAQVAPSGRVTQRLASAHAAVAQWVAYTPIGEAAVPMPARAARTGPTPLLDWVNAVQRKRTGADLSGASVFNLRSGFDSGAVRVRAGRGPLIPSTTRSAPCASAARP